MDTGIRYNEVDCPSNHKLGGVCIYHKDFLPIKVNKVSYFKECSVSVIRKQCNITLSYRSTSQSSKEFHNFLANFELLLDSIANRNLFVSVIIRDFNARLKTWWSSDKTTYKGKTTSQYGFRRVISDATLVLESSPSCICLIFTSQPNLVMNSGVYSSLHPNCHPQILHEKFNLKIFYPPRHQRVIGHH